MTRLRLATDRNRRRGFTLIELLVVISIIAVLLSLIAPAVQNARRAARRMECLSNMHNLSVAMQNFASTNNAQLPPLVGEMTVANTANANQSLTLVHNWVIPLLPLMDASALYRSIREGSTQVGSTNFATVKASDQVYLKVLTCPEDTNNFGKGLGLSYAANAGYISDILWGQDSGYGHGLYNVNFVTNTPTNTWLSPNSPATQPAYDPSDAAVAVGGGVFWRYAPLTNPGDSTSNPRVTLDSIGQGDGLTQTLMFAENVCSTNWSSPRIDTCAFGVAVNETTPFTSTKLWMPTFPATFGDVPVPPTTPTVTYHSAQINSQPLNVPGIPRPSSQHLGAVNVVMCDGSARTINESIDKFVYINLLSPDGKTFGQPLIDSNSF